ncbi:MAG: DUF503 family protein, partial [Dehalococcoidia bacterium]|nr:DUF503 family protein [Dehalococcoidia bacterium]
DITPNIGCHARDAMHVGVCQIQLRLPENGTLKDKRQVVRSVTSRTRQKFNVSTPPDGRGS